MIGILDADLVHFNTLSFPNLELMKIYEYHRARGEKIELLDRFSDMSKYDKVYVGKEDGKAIITFPSFPDDTTWVGKYYNGKKYKSLGYSIESRKPNLLLYASFIKKRMEDTLCSEKNRLNLIGISSFMRFDSGVEPNYNLVVERHPVFIYDYDWGQNVENCWTRLIEANPNQVMLRYPMIVSTLELFNLLFYSKNPWSFFAYPSYVVLNFTTEQVKELVEKNIAIFRRFPKGVLSIALCEVNDDLRDKVVIYPRLEEKLQFMAWAKKLGVSFSIYNNSLKKDEGFNTIFAKILAKTGNHVREPQKLIHYLYGGITKEPLLEIFEYCPNLEPLLKTYFV